MRATRCTALLLGLFRVVRGDLGASAPGALTGVNAAPGRRGSGSYLLC